MLDWFQISVSELRVSQFKVRRSFTLFFISHLPVSRPTLGCWSGVSSSTQRLSLCLSLFLPRVQREPCKKMLQSQVKWPVGFEPVAFRLECNVMTHWITLLNLAKKFSCDLCVEFEWHKMMNTWVIEAFVSTVTK